MNTLRYVFATLRRVGAQPERHNHFLLFRFLWDSLKSFCLSLRSILPPSPPPTTPTTRSSTPTPSMKRTPFHQPKTLVLDLDETLIHSTSRPYPPSSSPSNSSPFSIFKLTSTLRSLPFPSFRGTTSNKAPSHYMVEVVLGGKSTLYHVSKRPFVDFFLRTVSGWYTLVIFTASMKEYADPVIDWLDAGRGILAQRLFRDVRLYSSNSSHPDPIFSNSLAQNSPTDHIPKI